jgi:hypothetical protein
MLVRRHPKESPMLAAASSSPHPRATRLSALVSADESAVIASRAEAAGLSVSAYLRERALGDDEEALRQVDMIIAGMEAALDGATAELAAVLARLRTVEGA